MDERDDRLFILAMFWQRSNSNYRRGRKKRNAEQLCQWKERRTSFSLSLSFSYSDRPSFIRWHVKSMVIVLKRTSFVKVCLFLFHRICIRACLLIDKCITQLDILCLEVLLSPSLSLSASLCHSVKRNSIELGLVVVEEQRNFSSTSSFCRAQRRLRSSSSSPSSHINEWSQR